MRKFTLPCERQAAVQFRKYTCLSKQWPHSKRPEVYGEGQSTAGMCVCVCMSCLCIRFLYADGTHSWSMLFPFRHQSRIFSLTSFFLTLPRFGQANPFVLSPTLVIFAATFLDTACLPSQGTCTKTFFIPPCEFQMFYNFLSAPQVPLLPVCSIFTCHCSYSFSASCVYMCMYIYWFSFSPPPPFFPGRGRGEGDAGPSHFPSSRLLSVYSDPWEFAFSSQIYFPAP